VEIAAATAQKYTTTGTSQPNPSWFMAIKYESPNFAQTRSQVAHHTRIERQPKRRRERERERARERKRKHRAVRAKGIEMPSLVSPQTCDRGCNWRAKWIGVQDRTTQDDVPLEIEDWWVFGMSILSCDLLDEGASRNRFSWLSDYLLPSQFFLPCWETPVFHLIYQHKVTSTWFPLNPP
jgi:hypothetical protein